MKACIFDTETTDSEGPLEVIELAWQEHCFDGAWSRAFNGRFLPNQPSTFGALATHHILPQELSRCEPSERARSYMPIEVEYWIGHNVDFDWRALGAPPTIKRICTLAMARTLWPSLDSHKLGAMIYFLYGVDERIREIVRGAHGAPADVAMTRMLLEVICKKKAIGDYETLYAFSESARVPTQWGFGKFKGLPIRAADRGYANWYARQPDPDPYLLQALRKEGLL